MTILDRIKNERLYLDGAMGTMLQANGLKPGELPELWNVNNREKLIGIHRQYLDAGCQVISTNTFGINRFKFEDRVPELVCAAVENAKEAIKGYGERYIALNIGPTGKLLKPLGDLDFEEAVNAFAEVVKCGAECGADIVLIETMNDAYETKAAVIAAKENCNLPVFVTNVYDENGKLMTGANPAAMVALLEGMGVDALGINCSLAPKQMKKTVQELLKYASVPVIVTPNAGIPHAECGKTVFDVLPDEFAKDMADIAEMGAAVLGGCCGTTPEHMRLMIDKTKNIAFKCPVNKNRTLVSSYTHAVEIGVSPVLIGERINPTGKKKFKQALRDGDMGYILNEGINQQERGVHILDVNVGLPEIDEPAFLESAVFSLQSVLDLPLQIDTADTTAMSRAMRIYNGKPLVNSVNGKKESMDAIFPLVAKYGGVVIALTLDEDGIPETSEGRLKIAKNILDTAERYGISKKDIVFDPLAMAISADINAANVTLETVRRIKQELGAHTSLGVSNISFGLPNRDFINSTFFAEALVCGLDAAIMNPHSLEMMKSYKSFMALSGKDTNCEAYIAFASEQAVVQTVQAEDGEPLSRAIVKGLKERAGEVAKAMLAEQPPMSIINEKIIPALDEVGRGFENKTIFLPQLLMSAEAAKAAFEVVKEGMEKQSGSGDTIVIATVKGDIHDIGKNIVKVLLDNYGFNVVDLGKDVPPELIAEEAKKRNVRLVGLSALMTTTVPSMEETIKQLRTAVPQCKVVVGGAVLTQEYADMIGADFYAKDAMETVRYAERIFLR